MNPCRKELVIGVGISCTTYQGVADACRAWIDRNRVERAADGKPSLPARYICVTSVHGIVSAFKTPSFQDILNGADIATPDGMPVVWAMRSFGVRRQPRVYGPTLMLTLCEQAAQLGHKVFLYGASEESLQRLSARLHSRYRNLSIVGMYSPPFRPLTREEDASCIRMIKESGAELIFVGLSTPKQETWMAVHRDTLPGTVMVGVGAAFDFHAGRVKQAPAWMQNWGLEWLFRFCMEPRRLWKRYLFVTPLFLPLWALQKVHLLRPNNRREPTPPEGSTLSLSWPTRERGGNS